MNFRHLFRLLRDELEPRDVEIWKTPMCAVTTRKDVYIYIISLGKTMGKKHMFFE